MNEEILDPMTVSPAEITALLAADKVRYEKAFKKLGVRVDRRPIAVTLRTGTCFCSAAERLRRDVV